MRPRAEEWKVKIMAMKNRLLLRLLGRDKGKAAQASEQVETTQEGQADVEEKGKSLSLPPDHPLNQLWELYAKNASKTPRPMPWFEIPSGLEGAEELDEFMSGEYLEKELERLERSITGVAERRLEEYTKKKGELTPDIDAKVQLFMTADKVTAWIIMYPPIGTGADADEAMLRHALERSRVSFGMNEKLFTEFSELQYFRLYLAACGTLPVHGKDGYVIDSFSRNPTRALNEDESGKIDFAALEIFQNVKKGDVICQMVEPTACTDGWAVTNEKCYAHVGQPATVPKGRNTEISEDGTALIATTEGHVEFSGRSFQVKPVLDIGGNVDFSTGNINCLGDIHIHGDVNSGFTVRATGNITVDGVIEACVIEAGADLIVRKGVQGNGKAVLRAHRNIYAKYVESSRVYVRENLDTECLVNCEVFSDGKVTVRSGRGTIIGGKVRAANEVNANIVGARSECHTSVILGGRPFEEFEREEIVLDITGLEKEMEKLDRQPESPAKQRQLSKMRMQVSANKLKLQQYDKAMEKMGEVKAGVGRMVCSMVYPGTEITISGASLRVAQENRMCTASLVGGEVVLI